MPIGGIERKQNHNWNNGIMMKSKKVEHQRKCYAEPCAELDSVLVQHLTKSMSYETLKHVQGDRAEILDNAHSVIKPN